MRLSERMILGSTLLKHTNRLCIAPTDLGEGCALQLADAASSEKYAWIFNTVAVCPVCGPPKGYTLTVGQIIALHLNDFHKWNIEQIADWVRCVEPPDPDEQLDELQSLLATAYERYRVCLSDSQIVERRP